MRDHLDDIAAFDIDEEGEVENIEYEIEENKYLHEEEGE